MSPLDQDPESAFETVPTPSTVTVVLCGSLVARPEMLHEQLITVPDAPQFGAGVGAPADDAVCEPSVHVLAGPFVPLLQTCTTAVTDVEYARLALVHDPDACADTWLPLTVTVVLIGAGPLPALVDQLHVT
jgi:hypothetical protein